MERPCWTSGASEPPRDGRGGEKSLGPDRPGPGPPTGWEFGSQQAFASGQVSAAAEARSWPGAGLGPGEQALPPPSGPRSGATLPSGLPQAPVWVSPEHREGMRDPVTAAPECASPRSHRGPPSRRGKRGGGAGVRGPPPQHEGPPRRSPSPPSALCPSAPLPRPRAHGVAAGPWWSGPSGEAATCRPSCRGNQQVGPVRSPARCHVVVPVRVCDGQAPSSPRPVAVQRCPFPEG